MKKTNEKSAPRMGACTSCYKYTMLTNGLCKLCGRALSGRGKILFRRRTNGEVEDILGFDTKEDGIIPMRRGGVIVSLDDWIMLTERVARFYETITPSQIKKYNKRVGFLRLTADPSPGGPIEGYVYLLRSENGYYKIGRAKDMGIRLSSIQRSFPVEIKMVHCFATRDYVGAETHLHRRYSEYRMDLCEWFSLPNWAIEYITSIKDYGIDEHLVKVAANAQP